MKKMKYTHIVSILERLCEIEARNGETLREILRINMNRQREMPLAITQKELVEMTAFACREAGIPERAFTLKTLQRMESGKAPTRAGYRATVRHSKATCLAWIIDYVSSEKSMLRADKAVSYNENIVEHNN